MSDDERSALLAHKGKAKAGEPSSAADENSEATPLLSGATSAPRYDGEDDAGVIDGPAAASSARAGSARSASPASSTRSTKKSAGWHTITAIVILAILTVVIMLLAFFVPAAVEKYAKQAAVLEPTSLSLESITSDGLRARIQANFRLESGRVQDANSRRIGKATTWVVRKLQTERTQVGVYLPHFDNMLLGTATLPPLTVDIVDGHNTMIDVVTDLAPGEVEGIRNIANKWLEGKLDRVKLLGKADVSLKTGILPLGTHSIVEPLVVEANQVPTVPEYNISRLNFHDVPVPGQKHEAVGADVTITAYNKYPVAFDVPELGFDILLPNCDENEPSIRVAEAITDHLSVHAKSDVSVNAHGVVKEIPESLTRTCPRSDSSPFDRFLKQYLGGEEPLLYVRGRKVPGTDTPDWMSDILSSITVPVPFPGRSFDNLIKNFSLTDVDFQLPSWTAPPGSPEADPNVSGTIEVLAALPKELNVDLNVTHIMADADVYYKGDKFGELHIKKPQKATSSRVKDDLLIKSTVKKVPLTITDGDVFAEVAQILVIGKGDVMLDVKAKVAVKVQTVLGQLTLKDVPTEGKIPKGLGGGSGDGLDSLKPKIGEVRVLKTTASAIHIEALVNLTNPTPYTAHVPYLTVHVTKNGTKVGDATIRDVNITKGENIDVLISAIWNPADGGPAARKIGVDLISQYLSGFNTSVDIQFHEDSVPAIPIIGRALSKLRLSVGAPKLHLPSEPGTDPDETGRFIRDATFHFFSSTATFTLVSPFKHDTLYLEYVNATAFYNHTEAVGYIETDEPFPAPPGANPTPRLPVVWLVGSVGYEAVKKALGGQLKLDATADVTVRLDKFTETIWYVGQGIGAHIRP